MRKRWIVALLMVVLSPGIPVLGAQEPEGANEDNPPDGGATVPEWAKVSKEQIEAAGKLKMPVAKELDLGGGVKMRFVLIPAGEFMMGRRDSAADVARKADLKPDYYDTDERPQHRVKISKAFYMGVTELTQEQYEKVMGKNPPWFNGPKNPVEDVSWYRASEFCRKLSAKAGVQVRLPSEAEWEYACRAGSAGKYCFGDDERKLGEYAWYEDNAEDAGKNCPQPVGAKKPNAWGLHDMHGNVWEWCSDRYDRDYYRDSPVPDPPGPRSGFTRVLRGGSWGISATLCRSADRYMYSPESSFLSLGFRVMLAPK